MRRLQRALIAHRLLLPRQTFAQVKVAAAWPAVRQQRQFDSRLGAILDTQRRGVSSHIGLNPARMRRVDFDFHVAQLVSEMNRERIERGFRRVVSERFGLVNRRLRIGVHQQRRQNTRLIDDAPRVALQQKRQ